jgi:hypothetical protein
VRDQVASIFLRGLLWLLHLWLEGRRGCDKQLSLAEHWFCLRVIVAAATLKLWNLVMVFCEEPRGLAAVVLWEEGYGFYLLVLEIFCFYISPYRPIWPIFKPIHFCVF